MLRYPLVLKGVLPPRWPPLRYLELGFGQGVTINVLAAACEGEFWGVEFNPAHVTHAEEMRAAAGSNCVLLETSFEEFAQRNDLPTFDVIALHGVWSWIAKSDRQTIVDLIRRLLVPGGVVYISYNTLPGWSDGAPLRYLLKFHNDNVSSPNDGIRKRIEEAVAFVRSLENAKAVFFRAHPGASARLKRIASQDPRYTAHEYLTDNWQPDYFAHVARALSEAKLSFAASSNILDRFNPTAISAEGRKLLATVDDTVLRETIFDYLGNQQFRRDLFVKGLRMLPAGEQTAELQAIRFMVTRTAADLRSTLNEACENWKLNDELYGSLTQALISEGFRPKSLESLHQAIGRERFSVKELVAAVSILVGTGCVGFVQDEAAAEKAKPRCLALNTWIIRRSRLSGELSYLASPTVGNGILVPRVVLNMLLGMEQAGTQPKALAAFVWSLLKAKGLKVRKDGKDLLTDEENLAQLESVAATFVSEQLPLLQALRVI